MPTWLDKILNSPYVMIGLAGLAFLIALWLVIVIVRMLMGGRLRFSAARTRQARLGIVDAFDLDRQRQLIIVRRDNTEHLIMIGGPNDLVIESEIVRVEAREARRSEKVEGAGDARIPAPIMVPETAPAALAPIDEPMLPMALPRDEPTSADPASAPSAPAALAPAVPAPMPDVPPPPRTPTFPLPPRRPAPVPVPPQDRRPPPPPESASRDDLQALPQVPQIPQVQAPNASPPPLAAEGGVAAPRPPVPRPPPSSFLKPLPPRPPIRPLRRATPVPPAGGEGIAPAADAAPNPPLAEVAPPVPVAPPAPVATPAPVAPPAPAAPTAVAEAPPPPPVETVSPPPPSAPEPVPAHSPEPVPASQETTAHKPDEQSALDSLEEEMAKLLGRG